jgi:uridine phosphorylase
VLVCGDPDRATLTADYLENSELLSERREYRAYRGTYGGLPVVVCSHGIGAAGAAIAFEELIVAGAQRIIRIGSCGGLHADVNDGDLVVAAAAVDRTGYGRAVVPDGFPAVADFEVTDALARSARAGSHPYHVGIILTNDTFYPGVKTPFTADYRTMSAAGVVAVEMECAALFIVGSLRGVRTGAILAVDGNVLESGESMDDYDPDRSVVHDAIAAEIEIALAVLQRLEVGES